MFEKLILAFSPRAARAGRSTAGTSGLLASGRSGAVALDGGDDGNVKDPERPALTVTLVERLRLYVDPLNGSGGRVPCGPFSWKWEEPIGKLVVSDNTVSAWFYPIACGTCLVTVSGGKRESSVTVNVVPAVPESLNLSADAPEIFRTLAELDSSAIGVM